MTTTRFLTHRVGPVVLSVLVLAGCGGQSSDAGRGTTESASPSTPSPTPAPTQASPDSVRIPDDFPLALGLQADGDTTVTAQRRDVKGVELQRTCGGAVWPGAAVDRLVVEQSGPELAVTRELALYADPVTAAAATTRIRQRAGKCHRLPATSDEPAMDVTVEGPSGGEHAVSFAETVRGGEPGGSVLVFTQVGRAVLAVEDSGEWTRGSAVSGLRDLVRTDHALVARMCVFRDAGC